MSSPNMPSPNTITVTVPHHIEGKLPIARWDQYFHVITKRLAAEFPSSDDTERTNIALGHLQLLASGNAALDSLAQFAKVLQKRAELNDHVESKRKTKRRRAVAVVKRVWRSVFDF